MDPANSQSKNPIQFASTTLGKNRHICAFFQNTDEEYRVLLPFIKEGFDRGEKAFHVINPDLREDHINRLKAFGINVDAAPTGQFELCDWEEMYFENGSFDQNRMLAKWQSVLDSTHAHGFPGTRLVAHMEWALENRPGVNDLLEYEARFNTMPRDDSPVVCTYHLARFPANVIMDVLRTHPLIILGGILQENPFFVPPDEFLKELRQRKERGIQPN